MPSEEDSAQIEETSGGENEKGKSMRWLWSTFFANRAPAWTAGATIVLMVFSGLLWKVSDRANETSVASERAFVSFSGPVFVKDIQGNKWKGLNVYYAWSNSGTTPAKDEISEWNMSLGPTVPEKGLNFDNLSQNERMSLVLGPKAGFQLTPVYLSTADLEAVSEGKKHLFFWGWTTYRDIFSGTPRHLSEFCTDVTSAIWTLPDHTSLAADLKTIQPPCPVHNCYDEDCEDYSTRTK